MDSIKRKKHLSWFLLIFGLIIFVLKYKAYHWTGSHGIYSDALESIVNVVAALFAIMVIYFSIRPADSSHPYGHGKIEYFSSTFEGGSIAFAGIYIIIDAIHALIAGTNLQNIDKGLYVVIGAGVLNGLVGYYIKGFGKKAHSPTFIASGEHLISDAITSVGVLVGLALAKLTQLSWPDSCVALLVGFQLFLSGFKIVYKSANALLDAEDKEVIKKLANLFQKHLFPGIIRFHHTRVIRSGNFHHIDSHVVVPEFWSVEQAHELTDHFSQKVLSEYEQQGEIYFHIDPCRRVYCKHCDYEPCEVRQAAFSEKTTINLEELTSPTEKIIN